MGLNSNSKVMMDIVRLETEVRQKAQEYLDDMDPRKGHVRGLTSYILHSPGK